MTKYKDKISTKLLFTVIILIVSSFLFVKFNQNTKQGISNTKAPRITINNLNFELVGVADDFEKQRQGLSDRPELKQNQGMLFVWPKRQVRNFWMKNMNFPLDIIWIDGRKISHISKNLPPEGEEPKNHYSSILPVDNVLEINAGLCDKYGIEVGDIVKFDL